MLQSIVFRGARGVTAKVRFLHYREATVDAADQSVMVAVDGVPIGLLLPGDSVELDDSADSLELTPTDPGLSGVFVVGQSRLTPGQLQGTVQVDSGWRETITGRQGTVSMSHTAGPGLFPCLVIEPTPISTGLYTQTVLRSIRVSSPNTAAFYVRGITGNPSPSIDLRTANNKRAILGGLQGLRLRSFDLATYTPATLAGAGWSGERIHETRAAIGDFEVIQGAPIILEYAALDKSIAIVGSLAGGSFIVNCTFENGNKV